MLHKDEQFSCPDCEKVILLITQLASWFTASLYCSGMVEIKIIYNEVAVIGSALRQVKN